MTETLLLVRARLRRDPSLHALARLFVPETVDAEFGAAHRLVWALFADAPDRRRDFLWRKTASGEFLILARRPPHDPHDLFDLEWKEFAPVLQSGQRLSFDLRVNPTVAAPSAGKPRGKRGDVITRAIARLPSEPDAEQRRIQRADATREAMARWLAAQGAKHGFKPDLVDGRLVIDGEDWMRIPRARSSAITFLAVTLRGVLKVEDPARFFTALGHGFGAAKAFGCGLMLIRKASA